MTADCTAWKDWVSGESSRAVWFYRSMSSRQPIRTSRWKQLASALTSPDYMTNYDYNRTKVVGACSKVKLASDYLSHMGQYRHRVDRVLTRTGSLASIKPARGVRLKGQEPTDEELNQLLVRLKNRPTRQLQPLQHARDMATQLKQERSKRRALEEQLAALQQT